MKTHIPGKRILDLTIETEDIAAEAITDANLSPTGIESGSYARVTVNEKGRVVEGENPSTLAGYGIQDGIAYNDERFTISILTSEDESALRPTARKLVGTENQIVTIDSGQGGTFKLGLADNAVLPGTGAITLTSGTTAQRPAVAPGKIRFNTDKNEIEVSVSGEWDALIRERDLRLSVKNTLLVQKNPGPGQFASIKDAIASITDAAIENRYVIRVTGGSYYEQNPIQMKRYVSVVGDNVTSCIIHSLNPDDNLIIGVVDSSIQNLSLGDSYGAGASAIRFDNAEQNDVTRSFFVESIRFGRNARNLTVTSSGNYTGIYMSNCQFGGSQPYDVGFHVESTNGGVARLMMRSCTTRGSLPPYATTFGYVTGLGAEAVVMGSLFRTSASGTAQGIGYHLRDGGTIRTVGSTLRGFATAVWIENAGVAPMLNAYNLGLESNTIDLKIDHPDARGVFQGTATASKVFSVTDNMSIMYLDPAVQGVNIVGKLNLGTSQSLLTDVTDLIIETAPLGLLTGGDMTASGRQITISAGSGYLRKDGYVTRVSWPESVVTLDPNETAYLYINKNGQVLKGAAMPDNFTSIHIGRAAASTNAITSLGSLSIDIKNHGNIIETYLREAIGPVYISGSIVTENQSIPRAINVTAGNFYFGTSSTKPEAKVAPNLIDVHRTAGQMATTVIQKIPNDTIDNGADLIAMTPGYYTKHVVYSVSEDQYQNYYLAHGQTEYANIEDAITGPNPIPRLDPDGSPPIAAIITRQGVDAISQILDIRPMFMRSIQGTSGGTLEHGDLLGLTNDDHPQYLLTSGSRSLTGDFDLGGNDLKNVNHVNGIAFSSHGSRHAPQGEDPVPTGIAISLSPSTTNTAGITNTLARSDHTHAITGFQPLNSELTSLSAISTSGIMVHGEPDTWYARTITGANGRIDITNGTGISGNPTIDLATIGNSGTYTSVTTDAFGRVISGTKPTTLAGYGITDAVSSANATPNNTINTVVQRDASGSFVATNVWGNLLGNAATATKLATARTINGIAFDGTANIALSPTDINLGNVVNNLQVINAGTMPRMSSGTLAQRPASNAVGAMYLATDNATWYRDNGTAWVAMIPAFTGDATSPISSPTITLPTIGTAGTYDRVTVNAKGLVTGGTQTPDRMNQCFSGAIATQSGTSTIILSSTSVPTTSQGTQLVSQVITPATTTSRIIIDFCGIVDTNFNGGVFVTVFRGTTFLGMAITATQASASVSTPETFSLKIVDTPNSVAAQTYTIRVGGNAAGTWWLGRTEGLSIGGLNKSYWTMTEII